MRNAYQPQDLHPREERLEIRADHLLERHELVRAARTGTQRGRRFGTFTRAKCSVPVHRVANLHRERQRQVGDVRERVPGIDGERREHREDLRLEVLVDRAPLARRQLAHVDEAHAVRRELRQQLARGSGAGPRAAAPRARGSPRAVRRRTARRAVPCTTPAPTCRRRPADAHHEELVEVGAEDRQELQPLEQRHARIDRLVQHARVELEPAQLAVEIEGGGRSRLGHVARRRGERPPGGFRRTCDIDLLSGQGRRESRHVRTTRMTAEPYWIESILEAAPSASTPAAGRSRAAAESALPLGQRPAQEVGELLPLRCVCLLPYSDDPGERRDRDRRPCPGAFTIETR